MGLAQLVTAGLWPEEKYHSFIPRERLNKIYNNAGCCGLRITIDFNRAVRVETIRKGLAGVPEGHSASAPRAFCRYHSLAAYSGFGTPVGFLRGLWGEMDYKGTLGGFVGRLATVCLGFFFPVVITP